MKKCWTSLSIKETEKCTPKLHLYSISPQSEWQPLRKQLTNAGKQLDKRELYTLLVEMWTISTTKGVSMEVSQKINMAACHGPLKPRCCLKTSLAGFWPTSFCSQMLEGLGYLKLNSSVTSSYRFSTNVKEWLPLLFLRGPIHPHTHACAHSHS